MRNTVKQSLQKLKDSNKKFLIFSTKIAELEMNYNAFMKKMESWKVGYQNLRRLHNDLALFKEKMRWIRLLLISIKTKFERGMKEYRN